MIQRRIRDYEVSLWTLQDSLLAILKQYGLEFKGQIQEPKLTDRDDGTQTFSFSIPMYIIKNGLRIENPSWYSVKNGFLMINMRKIKVIFNKDALRILDKKIYEFLIVKVTLRHDDGELYCDIECEGLAFHELGKIGYKISLSSEDFYNDDYDWYVNGSWYDSKGNTRTDKPIATLQYWNDKIFSHILNWNYDIQMNWDSYSPEVFELLGNINNNDYTDDIITGIRPRYSYKVYEDDYVDSWKTDTLTGKLVPSHITTTREKARVNININESNVYNITQTLAELFGVFCKYEYTYDQNYHIINRTVIYYNNFLNEEYGAIDIIYPYNTSSIQREIDSADLVTKLFVKDVENTASAAGKTSIIDVGANQSQEDYILNFDYLYKTGGINELQYNAVKEYIINMHDINIRLSPISAKIISLEAQLPKLEAEYTTKINAIAKDTLQLYANKLLLNNLTHDTGVLAVTHDNPQTAVLLKDNGTKYESYYIKLNQKGIYALTIKLYRSYSYRTNKLSDEITTGLVEFDEYGNVFKVSNLFKGINDSSTVYVIYDYKPSLYYERISALWTSRLAKDQVLKEKLEKLLQELNYKLYGINSSYSTNLIVISEDEKESRGIRGLYLDLLQLKRNLIKDFNTLMGPALREGYWQPEDYADYGDKYTDTLQVGKLYIDDRTAYIGSSGYSKFRWDDELFDNEQQLFYKYSITEKEVAYPCINLLNNPTLLKFIQDNLDKNINFYFKPLTSLEDNLLARDQPAVSWAPEQLKLVKNFFSFGENNTVNFNQAVIDAYGLETVEELYNNYFNGKLYQTFADGTYKPGYTSFWWLGRPIGALEWNRLTVVEASSDIISSTTTYNYSIELGYETNIRFTGNSTYPQEIQICSNDNLSFENWEFRLIIHNNKGWNLGANNAWNNGSYNIVPTKTIINYNSIEFINNHILDTYLVDYNQTNGQIKVQFKYNNKDEYTNKFFLYYYKGSNNDLSFTSWLNNTETNLNYQLISQSDSNIQFSLPIELINNDYTTLTYNLTINNLSGNAQLYRFILISKNIQDYILSTEVLSLSYRVASLLQGTYYLGQETKNRIVWNMEDENDNFKNKFYTRIYIVRLTTNSFITTTTWLLKSDSGAETSLENKGTKTDWSIVLDAQMSNVYVASFITNKISGDQWKDAVNFWDGKKFFIYGSDSFINLYSFTPKLDICVPVQIIDQSSMNDKKVMYSDTINTTTVVFQILVDKYTTHADWHIQSIQDINDIICSVDFDGTQTIENNQYKASFYKKSNKYYTKLEITIPANSENNYRQDDHTSIYCVVNNISDNYNINLENLRLSQLRSITGQILFYDDLTISYKNLIINEKIIVDWWPMSKNISIFPLECKVSVSSNEALQTTPNKLKLYTKLEITASKIFQFVNDDIDINNIDWMDTSITENNLPPNLLDLLNLWQNITKINDSNTSVSILATHNLRFETELDLTTYQYNNSQLIIWPSRINDKKYGFAYKIKFLYDPNKIFYTTIANVLMPSSSLQICEVIFIIRIRQCPPIAKNNVKVISNQKQYIMNWGATNSKQYEYWRYISDCNKLICNAVNREYYENGAMSQNYSAFEVAKITYKIKNFPKPFNIAVDDLIIEGSAEEYAWDLYDWRTMQRGGNWGDHSVLTGDAAKNWIREKYGTGRSKKSYKTDELYGKILAENNNLYLWFLYKDRENYTLNIEKGYTHNKNYLVLQKGWFPTARYVSMSDQASNGWSYRDRGLNANLYLLAKNKWGQISTKRIAFEFEFTGKVPANSSGPSDTAVAEYFDTIVANSIMPAVEFTQSLLPVTPIGFVNWGAKLYDNGWKEEGLIYESDN